MKTKNEPIAWVDLLRIFACFLVVLSHSCDPFVAQFDAKYDEFLTGTAIGSIVRCCVPLFVMISGVLLLPVKMDMRSFYSRRAKRILIPTIFWALALPVAYYLYLTYGVTQTVNLNIVMEDHTLAKTIQKLYLFLFNFNYDIIPLWYVYMLIGLYLFMPVISPWLAQASKKEIRTFLYIWVASTLLPYMQMVAPILGYQGNYGNMGILGICDWNAYGTFYYFSGFLGYIVLAYYLVRFPLEWSWKKTLSIAAPLFLMGYAITTFGYIYTQKMFPGSYANLEIIWLFSGINVMMMTFSVFVVMQKIKITSSPLLRTISGLTFGIYLCHFIFVQMGYDLIYTQIQLPAYIQIPCIALFTFLMAGLVAWMMSLNKVTRRFIM